jgi:alkanesulfonate monooxygenase SsuD/methylene tetrahydromethanopterin reductase-like flavin-dependent oxidoreductase (luciferase family)
VGHDRGHRSTAHPASCRAICQRLDATGLTLEQLTERMARFDELVEMTGRRPEGIRRTLTVRVVCWRSPEELQARVRWGSRFGPWRILSAEQQLKEIHACGGVVVVPQSRRSRRSADMQQPASARLL